MRTGMINFNKRERRRKPMYRKSLFILTIVFIASGVWCLQLQTAEAQGEKVVMRIGAATNNDPQTYEMERFKELAERLSNGKLEVRLYPAGQLGSNAQMLQGLQAGSIHALVEPTAFLGGFEDVLTVLDLPYFFHDVWTATQLLNGPAGDDLRGFMERRGLVSGSFYPYGDRTLLLKFPVKDMDSFKGKKIRVMGAKVLQDEIKVWGGVGIPMGVPELFTALQQGIIDGLGSAAQFFYMGKYFQVAKYLFTEPKAAEISIFMINKKWLDGLPPDLKDIVLKGMKEIQPLAEKYARETEKKAVDDMKAAGLTVIDASPELKAKLKAACLPIHETFLKENPAAKPIYENLKKMIK
jgi:tripartite ATP-independent transporter DctP family solute receptor